MQPPTPSTKLARIETSLTWLAIYLSCGLYAYHLHSTLGFSLSSPWWTHITYMFVHTSPYHLILNLLMFYLFSISLVGTGLQALAFGIGILASFICPCQLPTVGLSGVVYSQIASVSLFYLPFNKAVRLCLMLLLINAITAFGNINVALHIFSYSITLTVLLWKRIRPTCLLRKK